MDAEITKQLLAKLVPENHLAIALDANKSYQNAVRILFEKRKIPENEWTDFMIEQLVQHLASLDSNNFLNKCGVGEREARIACSLVAKRHYGLSHGIGRSGDLEESQPKAVGSSIISQLTNAMLLDLIKTMGVQTAKKAILIPMATGMTLALCLTTLKKNKPDAKYVLWSRIDQKSCFKSILVAGLTPVVIDMNMSKLGLTTNISEFNQKIEELGPDNIVCIFSTTSCFAPRQCDEILKLGKLAKEHNIPHIVNNAYGLQSKSLSNKIENASVLGRVDMFVQSTDKNLMVPIGGAIVAGFNEDLIKSVAKNYAGRASSSQTLDAFMTLLSLGKSGYLNLVAERKQIFEYLSESLLNAGKKYEEEIVTIINNPISVYFPLNMISTSDAAMVGSMLYKRGVSGARVVTTLETKTIECHTFKGWGSHTSYFSTPYLTVAAGLGVKKDEIDDFIAKLNKILSKLINSNVAETE